MAMNGIESDSGALVLVANEGSAESYPVDQDEGDKDFAEIRDIEAKFEFSNISHVSSETDLLRTITPIADGDKLVIVKTDDFGHNLVASGVESSLIDGDYAASGVLNPVGLLPGKSIHGMHQIEENLYIISRDWDGVRWYSRNGEDIVDAEYRGFLSLGTGFICGAFVTEDGSKFFHIDSDINTLYRYDMSEPFNITTGVLHSSVAMPGADANYELNIHISLDGLNIVVVGRDSKYIRHWTFASPYYLSSIQAGTHYYINSQMYTGALISSCGLSALIFNRGYPSIDDYRLTSRYDFSTAVLHDSYMIPIEANGLCAGGSADGKTFLFSSTSLELGMFEMLFPNGVDSIVGSTLDTTAVTLGETPAKAFFADPKLSFNDGEGYIEATSNNDTYDTTDPATLKLTKTYNNQNISHRRIQTKIDLKGIGAKCTNISAIVWKES